MSAPTMCKRNRCLSKLAFSLAGLLLLPTAALAHPLGNFTVNHFTRLEVSTTRVRIRFVVDMAEIAAYQELQTIDTDGDGKASQAELEIYAERRAAEFPGGLFLTLDGARVPLSLVGKQISLPPGQGGLPTLRLECDYDAALSTNASRVVGRLRFDDGNHPERIGWREIAIAPVGSTQIFNSTAFAGSLSDELRKYPEDMLAAPLNERTAELSFAIGPLPANARPLAARDGRNLRPVARDRLAELINVPELTFGVALLGLLLAAVLGGLHAMSPGHGKTIVAAYLIGSRGTAKHAAFLGLTVTITHTAGVFALGLVTLFAAQHVVSERLYPLLSFISGAIIVLIGLSLFAKRLSAVLGFIEHEHGHPRKSDGHSHGHVSEDHDHQHLNDDHANSHVHSHGGRAHSHLPPGADGTPVTWRTLLALGVSGGLLPCPSALVVLLSAISLHRVGYGLVLVLAFSVGLASVLTAVGLLFVYARRMMERPLAASGSLIRVLPVVSAFVITCAGLVVSYQAIGQAGYDVTGLLAGLFTQAKAIFSADRQSPGSMGALAVLALGLVFGLKHASEIDHVVAVTTIVSEQRKLWRAGLVGALWGAGHTASLVVVGAIVLILRVSIPDGVASWLEFCVALMIILLGLNTCVRALKQRGSAHVHKHRHDGFTHAHIHFHDEDAAHEGAIPPHTHIVKRIGLKPLLIGAMHGLAGSAALTLLVLAQISSPLVGILYLLVFGLGSIAGMLLVSGLVGLPFVLTARKLNGVNYGLQTAAGALSICFGLWYAYETGVANGLLRTIL